MKATVRTWPRLAALMLGIALIAAALLTALALHMRTETTVAALYSPAEIAYADQMADVLDAPSVDQAGTVAGGYNACYWIGEYGIDPIALAGWDAYWSQPWEREWLAAAVEHLCPPQ